MTTTSVPGRGTSEAGPAAGIRLSALRCEVFTERGEPLVGWGRELMDGVVALHGLPVGAAALAERRGNSFITMSTRLLSGTGALSRDQLPALDRVYLAYRTPDLFSYDVAGCYLADHLPGNPVPLAVTDQGAGAPFTALRLAGAASAGGSGRSALFVYDQRAGGWAAPGGPDPSGDTDAAALLLLGTRDGVPVRDIRETPTDDPGQALKDLLARHPSVPCYVGGALRAAAGPEAAGRRLVTAEPGHDCTGPWSVLAAHWPPTGPVVLADHEPTTRRLHSCLITPEGAS